MDNLLIQKAILLIGKVVEVKGKTIFIKVNKNKNSSYLLFNGQILKNVSVGSYIKIQKGFLKIIGKIDGEKINKYFHEDKVDVERILEVSLIGYIENNKFIGGTKEIPLIDNEAFIITKEEKTIIHNLVPPKGAYITIARSSNDDTDVNFPIEKLFNSHIAIFGNTGSGKSNTLALLYQEYISKINNNGDHKFILFDFNGEYQKDNCITNMKKVYNLSTNRNDKNESEIPLAEEDLLNIEIFSILADATEKTQKPFLRNVFNRYKSIPNIQERLPNLLRKILTMVDKNKAFLLLDYFHEILKIKEMDVEEDFSWHNKLSYFYINSADSSIQTEPKLAEETLMYKKACEFNIENLSFLNKLIIFMYIVLIEQVIANRTNHEHIAPLINRIKSRKIDIEKIFNITNNNVGIWSDSNFIVINMNNVNLDMKKMIPLLLSKKLYSEHKKEQNKKALTIIIDEAHNILSKESFRESEEWKDFRLETFEEIIKEGRKFGVFLTISSQRPNDISETIISQAHNYFIHRLINYKDLNTISSAVSYIDKLTAESIPTLPVGTCIFSGIATQLPLKIDVFELPDENKPNSKTIVLSKFIRSYK